MVNRFALEELYKFPLAEHKEILQILVNGTKMLEQKERSFAAHISDKKARNSSIRNINLKYGTINVALQKEEQNLKPVKCKCGQKLDFDTNVCPRCGTLRADIVRKKKRREKIVSTILIILIVIFAIAILCCII